MSVVNKLYSKISYHDSGSAVAPSITFKGDDDTGVFSASANTLSIVTSGVARAVVSNTGVVVNQALDVTGALGVTGATTLTNATITGTATMSATVDQLVFTHTSDANGGDTDYTSIISVLESVVNATFQVPSVGSTGTYNFALLEHAQTFTAAQHFNTLTATSLVATSMSVVDTTAVNFNLAVASNSSIALTDNRTLTIDVNDVNRSIVLNGNLTLGGSLTTVGGYLTTITSTNTTNVTLPLIGTLATLSGSEEFTSKRVKRTVVNRVDAAISDVVLVDIPDSIYLLSTTTTNAANPTNPAEPAARMFYLPVASALVGLTIKIIATSVFSGSNITITPNGTEKIDGESTLVMSATGQHTSLTSDGSNWYIM
jgi:hypothetical protein